MRRAIAAAVAALLIPAAAEAAPLRVLASFLPVYLFTVNVAGGVPGVSVEMLLPASLGCPHDYALTPADMRRIANADLFVANGMGEEEFLGAPLRRANPKIRIVESAAGVSPLRGSAEPGAAANPHTWVSPRNAILQVRAIERALCDASPRNAPAFRRNADAYVARLLALAAEFDAASRRFRRREIVVFHNAFDYLARDLGLVIVGRVQRTPGQEPSAGEMARLVRTIRERKAAAVFAEPQYPARLAEAIAREAGVPVRTLDPVATGPAHPGAYEDAMRANLKTLGDVLGTR